MFRKDFQRYLPVLLMAAALPLAGLLARLLYGGYSAFNLDSLLARIGRWLLVTTAPLAAFTVGLAAIREEEWRLVETAPLSRPRVISAKAGAGLSIMLLYLLVLWAGFRLLTPRLVLPLQPVQLLSWPVLGSLTATGWFLGCWAGLTASGFITGAGLCLGTFVLVLGGAKLTGLWDLAREHWASLPVLHPEIAMLPLLLAPVLLVLFLRHRLFAAWRNAVAGAIGLAALLLFLLAVPGGLVMLARHQVRPGAFETTSGALSNSNLVWFYGRSFSPDWLYGRYERGWKIPGIEAFWEVGPGRPERWRIIPADQPVRLTGSPDGRYCARIIGNADYWSSKGIRTPYSFDLQITGASGEMLWQQTGFSRQKHWSRILTIWQPGTPFLWVAWEDRLLRVDPVRGETVELINPFQSTGTYRDDAHHPFLFPLAGCGTAAYLPGNGAQFLRLDAEHRQVVPVPLPVGFEQDAAPGEYGHWAFDTGNWFQDGEYPSTGWVRGHRLYSFTGPDGQLESRPVPPNCSHYIFNGRHLLLIRGDCQLETVDAGGKSQKLGRLPNYPFKFALRGDNLWLALQNEKTGALSASVIHAITGQTITRIDLEPVLFISGGFIQGDKLIVTKGGLPAGWYDLRHPEKPMHPLPSAQGN